MAARPGLQSGADGAGKIVKIHLHLPNLGIGGTERWALALMAGFPDVRWSLSVPDVVAGSPPHAEFQGARVIQEAQARGASDVLITTWGFHQTVPQPVISVAHAMFPAYRAMMRATPHDHAVAVSQAARSVFEEGEPVATIYNGVDLARLAPSTSRAATRTRLSIPASATVVGFVGRWGYQKQPLAAALAASATLGGVALYVSPHPGEDGLRQAKDIADLRLATPDQGFHIGDLYRAMDVCLVPSRSEGFSYAVAEAWFCETPVISTPVGIAAEHPELVVSIPHDAGREALETAVAASLSHHRSDSLTRARDLVRSRYSRDAMVSGWRAFLADAIPGLLAETVST